MSASEEKPHWTLDRRIPISLIIALIAQTSSIVWWARGQEEKSMALEKRVVDLEEGRKMDKVPERLAVIEHQLREQREATARIETRLLQIQYGPSPLGQGGRGATSR